MAKEERKVPVEDPTRPNLGELGEDNTEKAHAGLLDENGERRDDE